jgi:membrane protease YdiL (CAAX protease family)
MEPTTTPTMGNKTAAARRLRTGSIDYYHSLFGNPYFLIMAVIFIGGKISANLYMGAKVSTALRSGVLGFSLYIVACWFIHLSTMNTCVHKRTEATEKPYVIISWVIATGLFITLHVLQANQIIGFQIPLWHQLNTAWTNLVHALSRDYAWITGTGLIGWPYLLLYVFIPSLIARKHRLPLPRLIGMENSATTLPFVLLFALAYVVLQGVTAKHLFTLFAVIVWPAFGEEFLYRGLLQPTLMSITKRPVTAIVLTSLLFAASHIPTYVLAGSGAVVLRWSALLPIMLTSFFWGYGYYRTGVLWPWILMHAFSNLVTI